MAQDGANRARQRQSQSSNSPHNQSPIQQPSPMGPHHRSGSMGGGIGSPAAQGSPGSRAPVQSGSVNPSELMGGSGSGPGSGSGSPAFSNLNMSRPAGLHHDGSRPSTPGMAGTPGSSGHLTPSLGMNMGLPNGMQRNHGRQGSSDMMGNGSVSSGSPMMNGDHQQSYQQQQHQGYQPQTFNPQAMMGMNFNGGGNGNGNPIYAQQQQRQFMNNFQSLPPYLQQQMAQQMNSMNNANSNGQGGGIDMNAMMRGYQQQGYSQNPNQWNGGR